MCSKPITIAYEDLENFACLSTLYLGNLELGVDQEQKLDMKILAY